MKDLFKSYGGTVAVVLLTIAVVAYFAPEKVKAWLRI